MTHLGRPVDPEVMAATAPPFHLSTPRETPSAGPWTPHPSSASPAVTKPCSVTPHTSAAWGSDTTMSGWRSSTAMSNSDRVA